jgi:hypothetical protein
MDSSLRISLDNFQGMIMTYSFSFISVFPAKNQITIQVGLFDLE